MAEAQSGPAQQASTPGSSEPDCCDTLCEHACHMTAVTAGEPMAFAIEPCVMEPMIRRRPFMVR